MRWRAGSTRASRLPFRADPLGNGNCFAGLGEKIQRNAERLNRISSWVDQRMQSESVVHRHDHGGNGPAVVRRRQTERVRVVVNYSQHRLFCAHEAFAQQRAGLLVAHRIQHELDRQDRVIPAHAAIGRRHQRLHLLYIVVGIRVSLQQSVDLLQRIVGHSLQQGKDEFILVGEVGVQRPTAEPRCLGDLLHRGAGNASLHEHDGRGVEESSARLVT